MGRLLLVTNPTASGFTGNTYREVAAVLASTHDLTPVWPGTPEEAEELSRKAADQAYDLVVAFGGDGVAHHVANGLIGSDTVLGIIPAGTTNVLARILRIPSRPHDAAGLLAGDHPVHPLPVAQVASEPGARRDHTLFALGAGYDAEVVAQAERQPLRKLRFGGVHYARSAAWVLWSRFRHRRAHLRVESGDRRADAVGLAVQVHWPYTYFGRLPLSFTPEPAPAMAVLILERIDLLRAPGILLRTSLGRSLDEVKGVQIWRDCRQLVVEAEPPVLLQSDGELLDPPATSARITFVPDSLRVAAPARDGRVP